MLIYLISCYDYRPFVAINKIFSISQMYLNLRHLKFLTRERKKKHCSYDHSLKCRGANSHFFPWLEINMRRIGGCANCHHCHSIHSACPVLRAGLLNLRAPERWELLFLFIWVKSCVNKSQGLPFPWKVTCLK